MFLFLILLFAGPTSNLCFSLSLFQWYNLSLSLLLSIEVHLLFLPTLSFSILCLLTFMSSFNFLSLTLSASLSYSLTQQIFYVSSFFIFSFTLSLSPINNMSLTHFLSLLSILLSQSLSPSHSCSISSMFYLSLVNFHVYFHLLCLFLWPSLFPLCL